MTAAVAVVTGREYLFRGEVDTPPPCSALAESLHRRFSTRAVVRTGGQKVRDHLAVPGYGNGLSMLDHSW